MPAVVAVVVVEAGDTLPVKTASVSLASIRRWRHASAMSRDDS
jgi:hypothetical protein